MSKTEHELQMWDLPRAGPQPLTEALWGVEKAQSLGSEGMAFSPHAAEFKHLLLQESVQIQCGDGWGPTVVSMVAPSSLAQNVISNCLSDEWVNS